MLQTPHQGLPGAGNGRDSHTGIFPVLLAQSQGEIWFCSNHHVSSTAAKLHPKSFLLPAQLPLSKSCQFINDQALIADQSKPAQSHHCWPSWNQVSLLHKRLEFVAFRIHFSGAKIVLFQPKSLQRTPQKYQKGKWKEMIWTGWSHPSSGASVSKQSPAVPSTGHPLPVWGCSNTSWGTQLLAIFDLHSCSNKEPSWSCLLPHLIEFIIKLFNKKSDFMYQSIGFFFPVKAEKGWKRQNSHMYKYL